MTSLKKNLFAVAHFGLPATGREPSGTVQIFHAASPAAAISPKPYPNDKYRARQVACGLRHTLLLTVAGDVFCFGTFAALLTWSMWYPWCGQSLLGVIIRPLFSKQSVCECA